MQLDPVFATPYQVSTDEFELSWIASIPALGMTTYTIKPFKGQLKDNLNLGVAKVTVKDARSLESVEPFEVETVPQLEPFSLSAEKLNAEFGSDGLLTSITRESVKTPVKIKFIQYGTREQYKSGAYLFLPDGPAREIEAEPNHRVRVVRGAIRSHVTAFMPFVVHQLTVNRSPGGSRLDIDNLVNVAGQYNIEVGMRFETGIKSGNASYTDLNGLQVFF